MLPGVWAANSFFEIIFLFLWSASEVLIFLILYINFFSYFYFSLFFPIFYSFLFVIVPSVQCFLILCFFIKPSASDSHAPTSISLPPETF